MADETLIKQFLQNQGRFMGYLLAVTRDLHAAEEIFQNAAVAVIKGTEEPVGDFLAWSKEVVRRQALSYLRDRNRETGRLRSLDPALLDSISQAFQEDAMDPDHGRRERDALAACLRKLPGKSGEILARRYEHRESFEEIARATRSTASAIQRAISRLRRMLHDCVRLRLGEAS